MRGRQHAMAGRRLQDEMASRRFCRCWSPPRRRQQRRQAKGRHFIARDATARDNTTKYHGRMRRRPAGAQRDDLSLVLAEGALRRDRARLLKKAGIAIRIANGHAEKHDDT